MLIRHKSCLIGYLSHWQTAMKIREAGQNNGTLIARLPQPARSFTRREDGICLMLELLDDRLRKIEYLIKDVTPGKDITPFSEAYSEAMTFMDTIYIFLRSLLDDVSAIVEYFYRSNKAADVPKDFSRLLNKAKSGQLPEDLICILRPCQKWFPRLKKERDDIIHHYETNFIGFARDPIDGGFLSIQFSGKTHQAVGNGGIGIRENIGVLLANYQRFIDNLLDLWDRKFLEWYRIVSSRNSRHATILQGQSTNMLLWAVDYGGYTDEELTISRQ